MAELIMIYIVSNLTNAQDETYKIGCFKGSQEELLRHHGKITSNPILYFTHPLPPNRIQESIHKIFLNLKPYLIINKPRNKWFKADFVMLIMTILEALGKIKNNKEIPQSND